jgi:type II secretory pathway component PulC
VPLGLFRNFAGCLAAISAIFFSSGAPSAQQTREEKVRADRQKFEADPLWIYNDLAKGFDIAKKSGKPMFVVFRCLPCEQCVKLDDDIVNQDERIRPLLDKFTCVRVVSANGLDLALFQFDFDQSFAAFFLNADGTIYGRYGTRSHRTLWTDDVSIGGLTKALRGALDLHGQYPANRAELAGKRGAAPPFAAPEKFPALKERYGPKLNYEGQVVPSCIHCHQVAEAQRQVYFEQKQGIPEQLLFPYPHPKALGLILDPREKATVLRVDKESLAEKAGFKPGDEIVRLDGQPLLSIADVQWVLHNASPAGAEVKAQVNRGDKPVELTLRLPGGWRQLDDLSWRASTWALRATALGGMFLKSMTTEERARAGVPDGKMALRVEWPGGGSGPHGVATRSGIKKDDIVVAFDGRDDFQRESDVIVHQLMNPRQSETVDVAIQRDGKRSKVTLRFR